MTTFETIRLTCDENAVATLTLNRPQVMNAASLEMFQELRIALDLLKDLGARALLITGEGRAFCAGADLGAGGGVNGGDPGQLSRRSLQQVYGPGMMALANLPLPVVTAVNGAAAGIGCSLALAGDFVFAGQSGYFLQAFVNIGLVPDGGASWQLVKAVGTQQALRMMMLGERIKGEEAERIGLVYACVADEALQAEAYAMARRLAGGPTVALGLMRQLARTAASQSYPEALAHEAEAQMAAANTADAREGIIAFLQKRPARFEGR